VRKQIIVQVEIYNYMDAPLFRQLENFTYLQSWDVSGIEDFQLKSSRQIVISKSNPHIFGSLKK